MMGNSVSAFLKDWQIRIPLVRNEAASTTITSGLISSKTLRPALPLGLQVT
jgi:hypothetical protein